MLMILVVIANLMQQALQEQTIELTSVLFIAASQQLQVLVMVPLKNIKNSILEADSLQ